MFLEDRSTDFGTFSVFTQPLPFLAVEVASAYGRILPNSYCLSRVEPGMVA